MKNLVVFTILCVRLNPKFFSATEAESKDSRLNNVSKFNFIYCCSFPKAGLKLRFTKTYFWPEKRAFCMSCF